MNTAGITMERKRKREDNIHPLGSGNVEAGKALKKQKKTKKEKREKKEKKHKKKEKKKRKKEKKRKRKREKRSSDESDSESESEYEEDVEVLSLPAILAEKDRISADDYFIKSREFRTWLVQEKGLYFDEMSSKNSRKRFNEFVALWNNGRVKIAASGDSSNTTGFKWSFTKGLSDRDLVRLDKAKHSVKVSTDDTTTRATLYAMPCQAHKREKEA